MKFEDLPIENKFCPMPWLAGMITPHGLFKSCCAQNGKYINNGNLSSESVSEIRNNEFWKNLRRGMIYGEEHPSCNSCWYNESKNLVSLRDVKISEFNNLYPDLIKNLDIDDSGDLLDNNVYYWDVRQTNLCNMKCIMCGPEYSSLFNEEKLKHNNIKNQSAVIDANSISKIDIFSQIEADLQLVTGINFAGGEPLISDMHWKILDSLVNNSRLDVKLTYSTNLLKLEYKNKNAIDYWKKFKTVDVGVSLDAIGTRAEYIRFGTNWKKVSDNIKRLYNQIPNTLTIHSTITILNIAALDELAEWIQSIEKEKPIKFYFENIVHYPEFLSIKLLPDEIKRSIWDKIKHHQKLIANNRAYNIVEAELFSKFTADKQRDLEIQFKTYIDKLDKIRKVNIIDHCPELVEWYNSI